MTIIPGVDVPDNISEEDLWVWSPSDTISRELLQAL